MNGLYDAAFDRVPVIAITGMPVHDLVGTRYVQEIDTVAMMKDVSEYNVEVTGPQQALTVVDLACRAALSGACVAHIGVSRDIQAQKLAEDKASQKRAHLVGSASWTPSIAVPPQDQIDAAATLLNTATRPFILAGRERWPPPKKSSSSRTCLALP